MREEKRSKTKWRWWELFQLDDILAWQYWLLYWLGVAWHILRCHLLAVYQSCRTYSFLLTWLLEWWRDSCVSDWETKKTRVSYQLVLCFDFWLNRSQQEEDDVLLVALLSCSPTWLWDDRDWQLGAGTLSQSNQKLELNWSGISLFRKLDGTVPVFLRLNCLCLASCQAGHMHG